MEGRACGGAIWGYLFGFLVKFAMDDCLNRQKRIKIPVIGIWSFPMKADYVSFVLEPISGEAVSRESRPRINE
jgi:hypothetical protein